MAGPTLQLNITAPGQKSVQDSVKLVHDLAAALRGLPAASAALAALQSQLAGVRPPSGLKTGTTELKELIGEVKGLGAQLNSSFASLEQTIKTGWAKAAAAEAAGERRVGGGGSADRAAERAARQRQRIQNESALMTVRQAEAAAREAGASEAAEARRAAREGRLADRAAARAERQRQAIQNRSALMATAQAEAAAREDAAAAKAAARREAATARADARHQARFMREHEAAERQRQAIQNRSALMATAQAEAAAREDAAAAKAAARREAATARADARHQARFMREHEAAERQRQAIQNRSALMATAQAEAAAKEVAAAQAAAERLAARESRNAARDTARAEAQRQRIQNASALMATAQAEAAAKDAAAIEARAAQVAAAQKRADAAYADRSPAGQARTVLRARTRLDAGLEPEAVRNSLGAAPLAAAQATTLAQAYDAVHGKAKPANDELRKGAPAVKAYGDATRDLHSGLRGLASGFGQVSLLAASVVPLLAGAALSKGFTSAIRIGVETTQSLETMRVLSEESASAVSKLETQLDSLARTGPFGPRQIAEAMKTLSLAGLDAAQVAQALKPALDFAVTGGVAIEKAAESLVAIGTAYGYQAGEFSTVADAVTKAAAISMSSVEGMMESFRASTMVAQAYGVSLKDAAAEQALLANVGIRGSAAGTSLRQMYSELSGASRVTKQAMKDLGVEVVDANGKMKPLISIAEQLSGALAKYDGKGRIAAIQAISNERGGKGLIAMLAAFEAKAKAVGSTAANEFERIRQLIETSAGFNAIAASQLAATPENMLKGISASFENTLLNAYKAVEPTLVLLATRVREVFNSPEFQGGVNTAMRLMGAFSTAVIENIGVLQQLGVAFLVFKGLQAVQLAFTGLATASAYFATTGAAAAASAAAVGVTAVAATPALTGMAAATGTLSAAAAGLSAVLRVAGPLAVAITLAALAWQTYAAYARDARNVDAQASAERQSLTIESLKEEAKRLQGVTDEMRKGTGARLAEIKAKEIEAKVARDLQFQKGKEPLQERGRDLQAAMAEEDKRTGGRPTAFKKELQEQYQANLAQVRAYENGFTRNEADISWWQQVVKSEQNYLNQAKEIEDSKRLILGTQSFGENDPKKLAMLKAEDSKELQELQKQYQKQQQMADTAYKREMELLDIKHKGKLIADAEYANRSDQAAARQYTSEMTNLRNFVEESDAVISRLKNDPKAKSALQDIEREREAQYANLQHLQTKNATKSLARNNIADLAMDEDLAKLRSALDLEQAQIDLAARRVNLAPQEAAGWAARTAEIVKYNDLIRKQAQYVGQVQDRIDEYTERANNEGGVSLADEALISDLERQLAAAHKRLSAMIQQRDLEAGRAASVGVDLYKANNKPQWETFVQQGQSAVLTLQASRDEFMNGWVDAGKNIWANFLETGKLSFSSLGKLLIQTLADITYKRYLVKPFSEMGERLFDGTLKTVNNAQTTTPQQAGEALRVNFAGLGDAVGQLSDKLGGLGQDFWRLFVQAGQGLASMLSANGYGGAGGFLSGLFGAKAGGTSGSGTLANTAGEIGVGGTGVEVWAKGGAFSSSSVMAFAKGAGFHNTVLTQPTMFQYGAGFAGVAGEAGPEAVMPLTRGRNGDLGVRVHGGGGGGGGTTIVKNEVIIENHTGAQATQETSSRPDGSQLTRIVIGAVAKDISQGGQTRKAMRSTTKSAPNLPRY